MESPNSLKGGYMHPNEIKVLPMEEQLMQEAVTLGQRYVEALKEQISRQKEGNGK
jgi:hypothetical protein